jgi:hypothetical protein
MYVGGQTTRQKCLTSIWNRFFSKFGFWLFHPYIVLSFDFDEFSEGVLHVHGHLLCLFQVSGASKYAAFCLTEPSSGSDAAVSKTSYCNNYFYSCFAVIVSNLYKIICSLSYTVYQNTGWTEQRWKALYIKWWKTMVIKINVYHPLLSEHRDRGWGGAEGGFSSHPPSHYFPQYRRTMK